MASITQLPVLARLQEQLAERDEIILALQQVIRDQRHEIENLRVDRAYAAAFARSGRIEPSALGSRDF
jgi:hypothetical protein